MHECRKAALPLPTSLQRAVSPQFASCEQRRTQQRECALACSPGRLRRSAACTRREQCAKFTRLPARCGPPAGGTLLPQRRWGNCWQSSLPSPPHVARHWLGRCAVGRFAVARRFTAAAAARRRSKGTSSCESMAAHSATFAPVPSSHRCSQGVSAPTLQSALNYALLALVFTAVRVHRARGSWRLKCWWWAYALLGLLDVEANFVIVTAFRYTSLTRFVVGLAAAEATDERAGSMNEGDAGGKLGRVRHAPPVLPQPVPTLLTRPSPQRDAARLLHHPHCRAAVAPAAWRCLSAGAL